MLQKLGIEHVFNITVTKHTSKPNKMNPLEAEIDQDFEKLLSSEDYFWKHKLREYLDLERSLKELDEL